MKSTKQSVKLKSKFNKTKKLLQIQEGPSPSKMDGQNQTETKENIKLKIENMKLKTLTGSDQTQRSRDYGIGLSSRIPFSKEICVANNYRFNLAGLGAQSFRISD